VVFVYFQQEDAVMAQKPTYEELDQRVKALEKGMVKHEKAEEKLLSLEGKYRLLVENANAAMFIAQGGVVKFANHKTEDMMGYSSEELATIPFNDLIHPDDRDMVLDRYRRRLNGEEVPTAYTFRVITRDGKELWTQPNSVLTAWEGRPAILSFMQDITEKKRIEDQLIQTQKMEFLATFAGGIAHDFNNMLMGIQGHTSLMLLGKTRDHPDYKRLKSIEKGVRSGADLTRQLLRFSRGENHGAKLTDMNEFIKTQSRIFGSTRKEISIIEKYAKNLWPAEVDQSQIQQVVLNLYANAWQAMPKGGDLSIATENVTIDEKDTTPFTIKPGRYVKITFADTGVGMDEDTQQRIFDPFFTTKQRERGTGLGLATAYGIIKSHGGSINVASKKGEGTTFFIYLPASEKQRT
jgi:two-component system cell cycle sensor histidine kinase/response regulator CckA